MPAKHSKFSPTTPERIKEVVRKFLEVHYGKDSNYSCVAVYYSGHGVTGHVCGIDANTNSGKYSFRDIERQLNHNECECNVIIYTARLVCIHCA